MEPFKCSKRRKPSKSSRNRSKFIIQIVASINVKRVWRETAAERTELDITGRRNL